MNFSNYLAVYFHFKSWKMRFPKYTQSESEDWRSVVKVVKVQAGGETNTESNPQVWIQRLWQTDICIYIQMTIYIQMKMPMIRQQEGRNTRMDGRCDPKIWEGSLGLRLRTGRVHSSGTRSEPREKDRAMLSKVYITWQQPLAISDRQNDLWKHITCYYLYCNSVLLLCNSLIPQLLKKKSKGSLMQIKMLQILSIISHDIQRTEHWALSSFSKQQYLHWNSWGQYLVIWTLSAADTRLICCVADSLLASCSAKRDYTLSKIPVCAHRTFLIGCISSVLLSS